VSAARKRGLTFQMVRTACAPVQQLRPEAQIERCEGRIVESGKDRTLEKGGEGEEELAGSLCQSESATQMHRGSVPLNLR
jgi:hypothetical protein